MQRSFLVSGALAVCGLLAAAPAFAHEGHPHSSLLAGVAHPFTGLDHLLAMMAVGLVAFVRGRAFLWLPVLFIAAMTLGAGLGYVGVSLPAVETQIAASVLVIGLMLVFARQLPITAGLATVGLFAVAHGYAHASEMATGATALVYVAGFVLGTACLHALGYGLGSALQRTPGYTHLLRFAGLGTATVGTLLLSGGL